MAISPRLGPVTGGTSVTVTGLSFPQGDVKIQFFDGKNQETVKGSWISETLVTCDTPPFEKYGAGDVIVKVQVGGEGFTVHKVKFSYFVNTKALKCLAFGPGLLEEGTWGLPMLFMIQAKDGTGRNRTSGGDPFKVTVVDSAGNPTSLINIKDNDNGTYLVDYIVPSAEKYSISVELGDLGHIRGSPFQMHAADPWTRPKMNGAPPAWNE